MKKIIKHENGNDETITGSGKWISLEWDIPKWNADKDISDDEKEEQYFTFQGNKWYLSEFMRTEINDELDKMGILGIAGTSAFSGVGIALSDDCEWVKAYYIRQ